MRISYGVLLIFRKLADSRQSDSIDLCHTPQFLFFFFFRRDGDPQLSHAGERFCWSTAVELSQHLQQNAFSILLCEVELLCLQS